MEIAKAKDGVLGRLIGVLLCCLFAKGASACDFYSGLEIKSPDTDPDVHRYVTADIWAVWYHPEVFTEEEAEFVAQRLARMRCEAINQFQMIDPKAPLEGFYTNVLLHDPSDDTVDDGFPNDWGSAVGKNDDDYSQVELERGDRADLYTIDHEGWHVMQDQVDNRFEDVDSFSFWMAEASADWFAWLQDPSVADAYETTPSIASSPQLPFWAEEQSLIYHRESTDLVGTRPYAFNSLLAYLQLHTPLTQEQISSGYYEGNNTPQEVFIRLLGFDGFADTYADFNAKLTAMLIEGTVGDNLESFIFTEEQRQVAADGMGTYSDPDPDSNFGDMVHPIAALVDAEDLEEEWTVPEHAARPYGWGYNVVEIVYPEGEPVLEFEGRDMRVRLVTLVDDTWSIEVVENGDILELEPVSSAYLVITSTPRRLGGYERYNYRLRLQGQ